MNIAARRHHEWPWFFPQRRNPSRRSDRAANLSHFWRMRSKYHTFWRSFASLSSLPFISPTSCCSWATLRRCCWPALCARCAARSWLRTRLAASSAADACCSWATRASRSARLRALSRLFSRASSVCWSSPMANLPGGLGELCISAFADDAYRIDFSFQARLLLRVLRRV